MKSKESLKAICKNCDSKGRYIKIPCPFRSIDGDYCEDYEKIEQELKVLEIIKNHSYIHLDSVQENQLIITAKGKNLSEEECNIIKEWLEDGINE